MIAFTFPAPTPKGKRIVVGDLLRMWRASVLRHDWFLKLRRQSICYKANSSRRGIF